MSHLYELCGWLVIGVVVALLLTRTLSPDIVGLFHDDGVYLSVARSLATGGGYVVADIPGQPYESKYPPLLPMLLAAGWRMSPPFPANILWLKAMNLGFIAMASIGIALLAKAQNRSRPWLIAAACQIVFLTTPALVTFAD
jgi:hypothetical protein